MNKALFVLGLLLLGVTSIVVSGFIGYSLYPNSKGYKESKAEISRLNNLVENYEIASGYCFELMTGFDKRIQLHNEGKQDESDATISEMTVLFGQLREISKNLPTTSRFYIETQTIPTGIPTR